jgi:hypothetical protein
MDALYIIEDLENALFLAIDLKNNVRIQEIKARAISSNNMRILELIDKHNI